MICHRTAPSAVSVHASSIAVAGDVGLKRAQFSRTRHFCPLTPKIEPKSNQNRPAEGDRIAAQSTVEDFEGDRSQRPHGRRCSRGLVSVGSPVSPQGGASRRAQRRILSHVLGPIGRTTAAASARCGSRRRRASGSGTAVWRKGHLPATRRPSALRASLSSSGTRSPLARARIRCATAGARARGRRSRRG